MLQAGNILLLVSSDKEFCARMKCALETESEGWRTVECRDLSNARKLLFEQRVDVLVFDRPGSPGKVGIESRLSDRLDAVVSSLAVHAPVIVIGRANQREELKTLISAGVMDFVEPGKKSFQKVLRLAERRRSVRKKELEGELMKAIEDRGDFGQILRHELNNPLTGILGNAELLLAEIRRKDDGKLPTGGQQRVETIAALAVRLRETIRRLSQEWEARQQAQEESSPHLTVQS
jgi:signal transduction histidine kinase